jgi:hypothetical protein
MHLLEWLQLDMEFLVVYTYLPSCEYSLNLCRDQKLWHVHFRKSCSSFLSDTFCCIMMRHIGVLFLKSDVGNLCCKPTVLVGQKVWTDLLAVSCDTNILPDGRFQLIVVVMGSVKDNSYFSQAVLLLLVANLILFWSWLISVTLSLGGRVPKWSAYFSSNGSWYLIFELRSFLRGVLSVQMQVWWQLSGYYLLLVLGHLPVGWSSILKVTYTWI